MNRHEKRRQLVILIFLIKNFKVFFNLLSCLLSFKVSMHFPFRRRECQSFLSKMASVWRRKISAPAGSVTYTNIGGGEGGGTNSTEQKFISCINTSYVQVYLVYSTAYNPLVICINVIFDSLSISIMNIYVFLSRDRITRKIYDGLNIQGIAVQA